eukprot:268095-Lingulodinium_polyedra.AAC.1
MPKTGKRELLKTLVEWRPGCDGVDGRGEGVGQQVAELRGVLLGRGASPGAVRGTAREGLVHVIATAAETPRIHGNELREPGVHDHEGRGLHVLRTELALVD